MYTLNRKTQNKKKKTHVFGRMNILFFAVFLLFSLLVLRLGIVQIVHGEDYLREVERTEEVVISTNVPRGKMYDRNGTLVVDNTPLLAITYTKSQSTKTTDVLEVAQELAKLIEKNTDRITERDRKDYLLITEKITIEDKVPKKEQMKIEKEKNIDADKEMYQRTLDRITESELNSLNESELEILAIFREMNSGYALSPQIVKVGQGDDKSTYVTEREFAVVSEHLSSLPGINTTTDWEREYRYGDTLSSILGKITTSREGLPSENLDYYMARGYSRNDRVGKSFIELQYEDVLKGQKAKYKNITDKAGNVLETEVIQEGERGQDLILTIDMELQQAVDKIVEDELRRIKNTGLHPLVDRIFFSMMDPNTGEILAMSGKQWVTDPETNQGGIIDYAMGNFTSAHEIGSSVKGATVLSGYMNGALSPGQYLVDEPMKFKGTPGIKNSWFNTSLGSRHSMNEELALEKSSNAFMYQIALRSAGEVYRYESPLGFTPDNFETFRNYYSQFGLGVRTGIDLPGEQVGFKQLDRLSLAREPGKLLDLVIGQYDTYTPLQMLQYASTIANGGYRIAPKVVKEIREPSLAPEELGAISFESSPEVLNRLDVTENELKTVQRGFYRVYHYPQGTGRKYFKDGLTDYVAAGKTGTAEVVYFGPKKSYWGTMTENYTLIGYAPYDNPEVAVSTIVPWGNTNLPTNQKLESNKAMGKAALDKYFELKEQRSSREEQAISPPDQAESE
ncbi:peptidoglycan D,D-transpeptidase FtsI family protein [Bacillus sp. 2205SS5-2]|uniref:peptidoglycan D,D-transpeptidase FtsI family protein n=1 Tax=Bacillus sp. 2205SS5-2 TaxID=3109031 RepID=UPI003004763B